MKEEHFILTAARTKLSEENVSVLKALSQADINWDLVESIATKHEVTPLIYYSLVESGLRDIIPNHTYEKFKTAFFQTTVHNSIFLQELDKVSKIIKNDLILLKGIDLIQRCYPHIGVRRMVDIDLLIDKTVAYDNWELLIHEGFQAKCHQVKSYQHKLVHHHLPSISRNKVQIEIHYDLFAGDKLMRFTEEARKTSNSYQNNLYKLANEVMLIHLCIHFYWHLKTGVNLKMLCDINEFVGKYLQCIEWGEMDRFITQYNLKTKCCTALTYAYKLMDTPVPQKYLLKSICWKSRIALFTLLDGEKSGSIKTYLLKVNQLEKWCDKIAYIVRTCFPVKLWLIERHYIQPSGNMLIAYFRYWHDMINLHMFKIA